MTVSSAYASYLYYLLPLLGIWTVYVLRHRRRQRGALARLAASEADGLMEPASLHPWIDPARCLGCGTCVSACPEGEVLGLVRGKAELVQPANCIGHGACAEACPPGAIRLVLGTETRGVDIPMVSAEFETNVPGLFVAGELGGMGLIRNGIEQGRQAMDAIARKLGGTAPVPAGGGVLDVVIVGAGPAGLSATLAAKAHGLRYETLEQETLGGTVAHYPRGKIVMTAPVDLPLYGKVQLRETRKEALLELWQDVVRTSGVRIRHGVRVDHIERGGDGFEVRTPHGALRARAVLLAIGRRGTPRKLGVPGEEQSHVVYRLIDPEQYRGRHVLVVGGGDSALEAAVSLAREPGTSVALAYRGEAFARAKAKNRRAVDEAAADGHLRVMLGAQPTEIGADDVELEGAHGRERVRADSVLVCAGGVLPPAFPGRIGVEVPTRFGEVV